MADPCSFANTDECVCINISWFAKVLFDEEHFECKAQLEFEIKKDGVQNLVSDNKEIVMCANSISPDWRI